MCERCVEDGWGMCGVLRGEFNLTDVKDTIKKLRLAGLRLGRHYEITYGVSGKVLWTTKRKIAQKIAEVIGPWTGYDIDFLGGYFYWFL